MFLLSGVGLTLVSIIAFILILGIIIALHEFGHLIVAKKSGILCYEYSLGMGPIIYKRMIGETRFCIRAIPIGGFVSMANAQYFDNDIKKEESIAIKLDEDNKIIQVILDPKVEGDYRGKVLDIDLIGDKGEDRFISFESETSELSYYVLAEKCELLFEKGQTIDLAPYERTFDSKKKLPRLFTLFAGPLMNFILAIFIYFIVAFSQGVPNKGSNKIGGITGDFPISQIKLGSDGNIYDKDYKNDTLDFYSIKKGQRIVKAGKSKSDLNDVKSWSKFSSVLEDIYDEYGTSIYIVTDDILDEYNENNNLVYEINVVTILNSIGISNGNLDYEYLSLHEIPNTEEYGYMLGSHFSGWKNDIDKYDYMTKIQISGEVYDLVLGYEVSGKTYYGWSLLSYLMDTKVGDGEPKIYLEYYHLKDDKNTKDRTDDVYELVTLEESIKNKDNYKPYTDEVLRSQNIEKISHYVGVSSTTHVTIGCIPYAFEMFWSDFTMIFRTLKVLLFPSDVRQVDASNLSGVVGIFGMVKSNVNSGFIAVIALMAMLSVNIGIVNLLPIPALDGGRILFIIIEAITKKRVPKKVEGYINFIFFVLLMALMVYVTFNDVMRLF